MSDSRHANPEGRPIAAIILAAGKGTRMPGDLPKVAHAVADRPMVAWVVDAVRALHANPVVLVVGYRQQMIRDIFSNTPDVTYAVQNEQLGTGHATQCAAAVLDGFEGDIFVLAGDGPLIRAQTLRVILERHRRSGAAATLATSTVPDPTGYGRIVRNRQGDFEAIVEEKNATEAQKRVCEVNPSYYCFDALALFQALEEVERNDISGEYYVTDVPSILQSQGKRVEVIDAVPPEDVLSVNTPAQLAEVDAILSDRLEACR